jgi:hypothetical protein
MQALQQAILLYRNNSDAAAFVDYFIKLDAADQWRPELVLTVPVFLSFLMDQAPDQAEVLAQGVRGGDPVKVEIVAQAVNYCRLPRRFRLMECLAGEATAAAMDAQGADFKAFAPSHPVHVDMLWACWAATGDGDYLNRIVDLLAGWLPDKHLQTLLPKAAENEEIGKTALAGLLAKAAQVTLSARAIDDDVRKVLCDRAARCDGPASALAARIAASLV